MNKAATRCATTKLFYESFLDTRKLRFEQLVLRVLCPDSDRLMFRSEILYPEPVLILLRKLND